MGETNIGWAHYTVNAHTGCSKISPACKHCYAEHDTPVRVVEHAMGAQCEAESQDGKIRLKMWGKHNPDMGAGYRVETVGWEKQLRALNRRAKRDREDAERRASTMALWPLLGLSLRARGVAGHERPRVFINSLSDTFERFNGPVYRKQNGHFEIVANSLDDVRKRLFAAIEECTELDILLLTKRPENIVEMLPSGVIDPLGTSLRWNHVWFGTTVENQAMADKRIPELLRIPARVRFLSMEPLLGEVNIYGVLGGYDADSHIQWVIVGGESGKGARPMHPDWVRSIRDQCQAAGVPFFFKQWGEWAPGGEVVNMSPPHQIEQRMKRVGKKAGGRILDGRTWDEMPEVKR